MDPNPTIFGMFLWFLQDYPFIHCTTQGTGKERESPWAMSHEYLSGGYLSDANEYLSVTDKYLLENFSSERCLLSAVCLMPFPTDELRCNANTNLHIICTNDTLECGICLNFKEHIYLFNFCLSHSKIVLLMSPYERFIFII